MCSTVRVMCSRKSSDAHIMGGKQEELKVIVQLENYDIDAIMESWWDDSHDWSAAIGGYKIFRRVGPGRRGSGGSPVC